MGRGRLVVLAVGTSLVAVITVNHFTLGAGPGCAGRVLGDSNEIVSVVPSSTRAGVVYASSDRGALFVSSDGGTRWSVRNRRAPGWIDAEVGSGEHEELLANNQPGLFASHDGGRTWTTLSCNFYVADISASPNGSVIWVATYVDDSGQGGGLFRSTNYGKSWSGDFDLPDVQLNAVLVDPTNPKVVLVGIEAGGIARSADGGAHFEWRTIGRPSLGFPHGIQVTEFAASPAAPHIVWAGTRQNGIYRGINDGKFWSHRGLPGDYLDYLAADQRVANRVYAGEGQIAPCTIHSSRRRGAPGTYITRDGRSWHLIAVLPAEMNLADATPTDTIYAWCNHTIFSSANHGANWRPLTPIP
jgi:hypothetical protein